MQSEQKDKKSLKIAVIGAGLGGLTAAYRIRQQGYDVSVYEARARPGGRVCSFYSGNSIDEVGGKFLNDAGEAKNIVALAEELKLPVDNYSIDYTRNYYNRGQSCSYYALFDNMPYPSDSLWRALTEKAKSKNRLDELLDDFFSSSKELRNLFEIHLRNYEGPSTQYLTTNDIDDLFEFYKYAYHYRQKEREGTIDKYNIRVINGGNCKLVEALCQSLQGRVFQRMPLTSMSKADNQILLEFNDQKVKADIVVLALPCSTLRDVNIAEGTIPDDQMLAINTLKYGTNAKLIIPLHIPTETYPEFTFTEEAYTWFNQDHSILTCYYGGEAGQFDHKSSDALQEMMQREIRALEVLYPNAQYSKDIEPFTETDKPYIFSNAPSAISWYNERYSKGSYSYFGIESWDTFNVFRQEFGEKVREVFRPINQQIFFAGEHTALIPATLEGAVESGERAARTILRSLSH